MTNYVPGTISRREFMVAAGAGILAGCTSPGDPIPSPEAAHLTARPRTPDRTPTPGVTSLGLGGTRDGFLYVSPGYVPSKPAALIVLLHGAGGGSQDWANEPLEALFGSRNIVVMGPDSRRLFWDIRYEGFGVDVEFIDRALDHTFSRVAIDPSRIALGGFSDGASYALSLGVTNGDLFTHVLGFSPGFYVPDVKRGKPKIFVSHGIGDPVLPFGNTRDLLVPQLRSEGYNVELALFQGVHEVPFDIETRGMDWFLAANS